MSWFDDNVRFYVGISSNVDAINPQNPVDIAIRPGGPNGAPLGWVFEQPFPTVPLGTDSYRGRVISDAAYVEYIGVQPLLDNNPPGHSGIHLTYYFLNPVVGHRYMVSAEIGGSTDRHSGTGIQLQVNTEGGAYDSFQNGAFNGGFPQVGFNTVVAQQTNPVPTGTTSLKIRFYVRSAVQGGQGTNTLPWTGIVRRVQVSDLDASATNDPLTPTFYPVECDSQNLTIRYGRARYTERYDVGVFNVQLNNVQGDYSYNPNHPLNFAPGRLLRVRAQIGTTAYRSVCYGIIRTIAHRMEPDQTATVILGVQDPTSLLSEVTVPSLRVTSGFFDSGWRIASLLDYAGIPENWQSVEPGQWRTQHITQSGRSVREEIGVTADSEGGSFYGDRDGEFRYFNRVSVANDPKALTVQAQVNAYPDRDVIVAPVVEDGFPTVADAPTICPHEIETEWSTDRVINRVSLAVVGGNTATYNRLESQKEYGIKTYQRLDFVLEGPTESQISAYLAERATDYLNASERADLRVIRMSFRPREDTYAFALDVWLNWALRVLYFNTRGNWGFQSVSRVQAIEHTISPSDWIVHITLDQSTAWTELVALDPGGWDIEDWDETVWDAESASGAIWSAGMNWSDPNSKWGV